MRNWSLHPKYLDAKGLVALWREALLAKNVLEGKTAGYRNHPQLTRFKQLKDPVNGIDQYLSEIYNESVSRGYSFDGQKINWQFREISLPVTTGQLDYEVRHLLKKLKTRDIRKFEHIRLITVFETHPMFTVVGGDVEGWERI